MYWVVAAIVVAGILIADAIKKSSDEKAKTDLINNMSDVEKQAYYHEQHLIRDQSLQKIQQNHRLFLYKEIFSLKNGPGYPNKGKSDNAVAENPKVQKLAQQAGLSIRDGEDVRSIMLSYDFLNLMNLLPPLRNMIKEGFDDTKISKRIGGPTSYINSRLDYTPDHIKYLRDKVL